MRAAILKVKHLKNNKGDSMTESSLMREFPKIDELSEKDQYRLELCCEDIVRIMDKYFPELRKARQELEERIFMTLYLETIHMGLYKKNN